MCSDTGNDCIRVLAHARNPVQLAPGFWVYVQQLDNGVEGWIMASALDTSGYTYGLNILPYDPPTNNLSSHNSKRTLILTQEEFEDIVQQTSDKTEIFGVKFESYVSAHGTGWTVTPLFTHLPLSMEKFCPAKIGNIADYPLLGLGYEKDPENPQYENVGKGHPGIDFFADVNSKVVSVANNGLVVGIGRGEYVFAESPPPGEEPEPDFIKEVPETAGYWGAAGISEQLIGYNVIVRYGHLYIVYSHLRTIDKSIFVGAPIDGGQFIGTIGTFNNTHLHLEVRNFHNQPHLDALSPTGAEYGFVKNTTSDSLSANSGKLPAHRYDLFQLFELNGLYAWETDAEIISGQSPTVSFTNLNRSQVALTEVDPNNGGIRSKELYNTITSPSITLPECSNYASANNDWRYRGNIILPGVARLDLTTYQESLYPFDKDIWEYLYPNNGRSGNIAPASPNIRPPAPLQ